MAGPVVTNKSLVQRNMNLARERSFAVIASPTRRRRGRTDSGLQAYRLHSHPRLSASARTRYVLGAGATTMYLQESTKVAEL